MAGPALLIRAAQLMCDGNLTPEEPKAPPLNECHMRDRWEVAHNLRDKCTPEPQRRRRILSHVCTKRRKADCWPGGRRKGYCQARRGCEVTAVHTAAYIFSHSFAYSIKLPGNIQEYTGYLSSKEVQVVWRWILLQDLSGTGLGRERLSIQHVCHFKTACTVIPPQHATLCCILDSLIWA